MDHPLTFITPSTGHDDLNAELRHVRYCPGMQICVSDDTFSARLQEVADAGFRYTELKFKSKYKLHEKSDEEIRNAFRTIHRLIDSKGMLVWSIHLPFGDSSWNNIGAEEESRTRSTRHYIRVMELCAEEFTSCRNFVLHASKGALTPRSESVIQARKALTEMIPVADRLGVRICVENLVTSLCRSWEEMETLCEGYPELHFTFDIGHANCNGADVVEFLSKEGTRLGTIHIHDTFFGSGEDSHLLVGQGNINRWGEVYRTLIETNRYRGVFMFEPKDEQSAKDVMASYERIVDDFVKLCLIS